MNSTQISGNEAIHDSNGEDGQFATAPEQPRLGALYGRDSQNTTDKEMLDLLHNCFGFSEDSPGLLHDAVLVSVDLERTKHSEIREIGISTLDLRDVKKTLDSTAGPGEALSPVRNYNFRVLEKYRFDQPYIFGDTVELKREEVAALIQRVYRTGSPTNLSYEAQNVVIVGHSFYFDQNLLALNNIILPELQVLDTCGLALYLFGDTVESQRPDDFQLKNLIRHFEIRGDHFHVAGNDSNFTLKLLLMLVVMRSHDRTLSEGQQATVSALLQIAHAPWPAFSWKSKKEHDIEMMAEVQNKRIISKAEHFDVQDEDSEDNFMDIFGEQD